MTGIKAGKKPPISTKVINIAEAEIISESKIIQEEVKKPNVEELDYAKNLKEQKTVDLGEVGKKSASEKVTIDFMNAEHLSSLTSGETKKADETLDNKGSAFDGKSVDDLKADIKKAEEDSTKNFTAKDFEDIAKFIVFLIDTGLSSALKWWSKDTSDAAYSLPEKKKDMLVYQLTLILTKYQAKFSIEFMFLLTILIVYAPAFVKAKNRRKDTAAKENNTGDSFDISNYSKGESIIDDAASALNKEKKVDRRRRGNPGKA